MSDKTNSSNDVLDDDLRMRVSKKALAEFKKKSMRITKKPYQIFIREIIDAFNNGKLIIVEDEETKREKEELYQ